MTYGLQLTTYDLRLKNHIFALNYFKNIKKS
jgi:hypothetical protein